MTIVRQGRTIGPRAPHILFDPWRCVPFHLSFDFLWCWFNLENGKYIQSRYDRGGVLDWFSFHFYFPQFAAKGCVGNMVVVFWQPSTYISLTELCIALLSMISSFRALQFEEQFLSHKSVYINVTML